MEFDLQDTHSDRPQPPKSSDLPPWAVVTIFGLLCATVIVCVWLVWGRS